MTLNEVYLRGKNVLATAKIEAPAFDAMQIFEKCFKLTRQDIIVSRSTVADVEKTRHFFKLIEERATGRPLQYILGTWTFMNVEFKVGEGVLIPRDDTEVLVNAVLAQIKNVRAPKILDLCAGPGTIAITLAKKQPDANVVAVELSEIALNYLHENLSLNSVTNVEVVPFDVLSDISKFPFSEFDVIVSNPPYIPSEDLKMLQKEVQYEPKLALDGGFDGLKFYRAIAKNWTSLLKKSGCICVEVGQGQARKVADIFEENDLRNIQIFKDLADIDRVVVAQKL